MSTENDPSRPVLLKPAPRSAFWQRLRNNFLTGIVILLLGTELCAQSLQPRRIPTDLDSGYRCGVLFLLRRSAGRVDERVLWAATFPIWGAAC